ncbi:MAG TPA: hypothetical protein VGU44_05320, partial [Gammaproteobacteria bacterium]|nr:hypothetical protein [Gammaproteobacteria bacterium]
MLQATEELQDTQEIPMQHSAVKASANDAIALAVPNASVALKVLSHKEFLLSSYSHSQKQGQDSILKAPYYLVIAAENGEQDISGALSNSCIPLIVDATKPESFDWHAITKALSVNEPDMKSAQTVKILSGKDAECSKKASMVVATSKGALCFKLSPKGNIELLSAPSELALAVSTRGVVSHEGNYKSTALTVRAKSFVNKAGTLSVDNLNLNCTSAIVNAGTLCTKNLQVSGRSQLCNRKHAKIIVEQRCVIQQAGELKNLGLISSGREGCVLEARALHNAGKVSSLGTIELTVAEQLHNHSSAVMSAHEKVIIHQAPEVLNHGKLVGKQGLQLEQHPTSPNRRFVNAKHGSVLSDEAISLSLGTIRNKGNIKGAAVHLIGAQNFENHGHIDAQKQSLVIQVPGVIQHQEGVLSAKQGIMASAEAIQNAAMITGEGVSLTAARIIENQSSATVIARDKLVASAPCVLNANQMRADRDASITAERFENQLGAEVVARNGLFALNASQTVNRGKILARNATLKRMPNDAETLTLDNTEGIIDIQKRLILQQGRIKNTRGRCFAETLRGNTTGALNNQHGRIQVRKRARLNIRGALQNSHGAIVQHLGQADNVKPDSTGIWIKTRENIRCTDGSEISAVQGVVDIKPAIPGSRVENTQKIMVDDSSRIGGATATNIVGFNRVRFSTPATGNKIDINSDTIQLERGVLTESAVPITQTQDNFHSQNLWKTGSAAITQTQGKFRFEDIWKAGNTILHLSEGETITQPYTALGSLSYHLAPTATQPLVFLANQTSLHGDFAVEAPVPVKMGDATHFVTIKTEYGNVSVKAPIFDVEQGGVVSIKSFIEAPGGFTLGRLVEDPTRQAFSTIYGHAQAPGGSS